MVTRVKTGNTAQDAFQKVTRKVAEKVGPFAGEAGKTARKAAKAVQKDVGKAVSGTLGLSGERMTKVDTAWLRMDSESNLMMIIGVWIMTPSITHAALCQRLEERLLKYPRFTQRVVQDSAGATWVKDTKFDIAQQVVVQKLPGASEKQSRKQSKKQIGRASCRERV